MSQRPEVQVREPQQVEPPSPQLSPSRPHAGVGVAQACWHRPDSHVREPQQAAPPLPHASPTLAAQAHRPLKQPRPLQQGELAPQRSPLAWQTEPVLPEEPELLPPTVPPLPELPEVPELLAPELLADEVPEVPLELSVPVAPELPAAVLPAVVEPPSLPPLQPQRDPSASARTVYLRMSRLLPEKGRGPSPRRCDGSKPSRPPVRRTPRRSSARRLNGAPSPPILRAVNDPTSALPLPELPPPDLAAQRELGMPTVLEALAARCRTPLGAERARERPLLPGKEEVEVSLARIEEARVLAGEQRTLPLGGVLDVRPALELAAKGGLLESRDLIAVAHAIGGVARTRDALKAQAGRVPLLAAMGAPLCDLTTLGRRIESSFEPSGEVSDRASATLAQARERSRGLHRDIKRRIEGLLADVEMQEVVRDAYFTLRNDRYVIPVQTQHRARVPGIVHNASQTGQTLFVEPDTLIPLGNELAISQSIALEEERRVLQELTDSVGERADELVEALAALAALDEVESAARLANELLARVPTLTGPHKPFQLVGLRHPLLLLQAKRVIASDVRLESPSRALVISGPNAGGKTVTLTGVGLAALMLRLGLPIPVDEGSTMPLYTGVYASIGDAQDLGRDLSTFSAHVTRLRDILARSGPASLVLVDEMAAATDPREGGALAAAILVELADLGATTLVTTHLEALKALGLGDPRFTNAHVGFDPVKLSPTYRLHLGMPGASSAIEIAERVGLPKALCERARSNLDGTSGPLAKALDKLDVTQRELDRAHAEARTLRAQAEHDRELAEKKLAAIDGETRREAEVGRKKLLADLQAAQLLVSELVAELQIAPSLARAADAQRQIRSLDAEQKQALANESARESLPAASGELKVGGRVRVVKLGRDGEVVEISGDEVVVQAGPLKMRARREDVVPLGGKAQNAARFKEKGSPGESRVEQVKAAATSAPMGTVNVRGMRADDAVREVEASLDGAFAEGRSELLVVHGHGTGALKATLRRWLDESRYVATWKPAEPSEGGDGATRITLRG